MIHRFHIRVHHVDDARTVLSAAAALGALVALESPAGAALWQGLGWWRAIERRLRAAFPAHAFTMVLDCADAPALAMMVGPGASVRLDASAEVVAKIAAMGIRVIPRTVPIELDLAACSDAQAALALLLNHGTVGAAQ